MPAKKRGWRRAARIVGRIMLGVTISIFVVIGALLIVLHTDWGRAKLRDQIVAQMDDVFVGGVEIGSLEGSVLGEVVLRDVVIHDREGRAAITIDRLRLEVALTALVQRRIELEHVVAEGVAIDVRRRGDVLNLAGMIRDDGEPSTWSIAITDFAVRDAGIAVDLGGRLVHFDEVSASGALVAPVDGSITGRIDLAGAWRERAAPITARAELRVTDATIELATAELAIGEVRIAARDVELLDTGIAGALAIDAPAGAIAHLLPNIATSPAVALRLTAQPATADGTTVTVAGSLAGARLGGALTLSIEDRPKFAGTLTAKELDASRFADGAIATMLDARITIDVIVDPARDGLAMLGGDLVVHGAGRVGGVVIDDAAATISLADGIATIDASARAPGGARAQLEASGTVRDDGAIVISRAHLVASAGELRRATGGRLDVGGAIELDLAAAGLIRGGVPELEVTGHVTGHQLRAEALAIEHVQLRFALAGTPARPTGRIELAIDGAKLAGRPLPVVSIAVRSRTDGRFAVDLRSHAAAGATPIPWSVVADAVVRIRDNGASIALGRYAARTHDVTWRGHGGVVELDRQRVTLRGIRATVAGGTIAIAGSYQVGGSNAGDLTGTVVANGLELAAIGRALVLPGDPSGRASFELAARLRAGIASGSLVAGFTDLVAHAGADPIDVALDASLSPSRLTLDVKAGGTLVGRVAASLEIVPPRRLDDLAAWSRIERAHVREGTVRVTALDLAALARAAGVRSSVDGRIDAELVIGPAEIRGTVHARDIVTTLFPAPLELDVAIAGAGATVRATARAIVPTIGRGEISATVRIPDRLFDPAAWARLDATAVDGVHVAIDELVLDDQLAGRLGVTGGWRGRAVIAVDIASGLTGATATISARGIVGGPITRPIDVTITATGDRAGIRLTTTAGIDGKSLASAELALAIDPRAIARGGLAAVRRAQISGALTVARSDLATIVAASGIWRPKRAIQGTFWASATLRGTLDAPVASATIGAADVGFARRVLLRTFAIDAELAGGVVTAHMRARQDAGGALALDTRIDLAQPEFALTTLTVSKLELRPLLRLAPVDLVGVTGRLDADLRLRGLDPTIGELAGTIRIRNATLPVTNQFGVVRDAAIDLAIHDQRAELVVDGKLESGTLSVRADATLQGLVPRTAVIDLTAVDISVLTASAPRIGGSLHVEVLRRDGRWKVDAVISDGRVTIPKDGGRTLHPTGIPDNMVVVDGVIPPIGEPHASPTSSLPFPMSIDVAVQIRPVQVTSEEFRGRVSGALEIALGDEGTTIYGSVEIIRGEVTLLDRRYRVERAAVRFDGGIDPLLDILLVHDFPQLTLRIAVTGRFDDPRIAFTSEPGGYSEAELVGVMLGGGPGDRAAGATDDLARGAATAAVTQVIGRYLDGLLPVRLDVLRYEAATSTRSGSLTIGRRLGDRLFVSWRNRIDARADENTGEALLEYWLSRRLLLEGVVGASGVHGLDLLWTRRW